jgi:hypothetical protein
VLQYKSDGPIFPIHAPLLGMDWIGLDCLCVDVFNFSSKNIKYIGEDRQASFFLFIHSDLILWLHYVLRFYFLFSIIIQTLLVPAETQFQLS